MHQKEELDHELEMETGITKTVNTIFSKLTVEDIINQITSIKINAIRSWFDQKRIENENTLIIGAYLTGAKLANLMVRNTPVTLVDIYPQLKDFLNQEVIFKNKISEVDATINYGVVIDTTGIGGLNTVDLGKLSPSRAFLVENPCSDGSDYRIKRVDESLDRLEVSKAKHRGFLFTLGLNSKTSGTMTLTMEVLRHSWENVLQKEGVMYAVSSLDFYERILFKEKDPKKFIKSIRRPGLIISSVEPVNVDNVIQEQLKKIKSQVIDYKKLDIYK